MPVVFLAGACQVLHGGKTMINGSYSYRQITKAVIIAAQVRGAYNTATIGCVSTKQLAFSNEIPGYPAIVP